MSDQPYCDMIENVFRIPGGEEGHAGGGQAQLGDQDQNRLVECFFKIWRITYLKI